LRAAFAVADALDEEPVEDVEHAPLLGDAVTIVDDAGVAVDDVMGANREDELPLFDDDPPDVDTVLLAPRTAVGRLSVDAGEAPATIVTVAEGVVEALDVEEEVDVEDAAVVVPDEAAEVVELDVLPDWVVADEAVAEAGEQAVRLVAVAAGAPETVPAVALVVCVPLAVPPDVLMKIDLRTSAFCQYCGAASITT
jgi:hypothetical protein